MDSKELRAHGSEVFDDEGILNLNNETLLSNLTSASPVSPLWIALFFLIAVLGFWAIWIEPQRLQKKLLKIENWPGPPLRIAFFSDLHAGTPHINVSFIEKLVELINSENPDIILIGGDFCIYGMPFVKGLSPKKLGQILSKLKAKMGVYAVLGNHEWELDTQEIADAINSNGIKLVDNTAQFVQVNSDDGFWLLGVGDVYTRHDDIAKALDDLKKKSMELTKPESKPILILTHDPAAFLKIEKKFSLGLAGHTHAGQVRFPLLGALFTATQAPRSWAQGLSKTTEGQIFVSNGVGTSTLPIRFISRPEYVIVDLVNSNKK